MKVLVSDLGGVLCSYHPSLDLEKHKAELLKALAKVEKKEPEFAGIVEEYSQGMTKRILEAKNLAVKKGWLKIYPNHPALTNLRKNLTEYKLVIVSNSLLETSIHILEQIAHNIKILRIFDVSDYGSKRDKETWKKIFIQLPGIDAIVEDSQKNLHAATLAAQEQGYSPQAFNSMPLLISSPQK